MTASDELRTIRLLRYALAAIWTALEYDDAGKEEAIAAAQTIADEGLKLSVAYASRGKDLTDDSTGLASWRRHVNEAGVVIKEPW